MPGPNEAMPKAASEFFRNHREIRSLRLDLWHMSNSSVSDSDDEEEFHEHQTFTSSYALHTLFQGFEPRTVNLHNLDLGGVDLRGEHSDLAAALNLPVLSKLCFRKCWQPEDFLIALVKAAGNSPLKLQHLSIYHWEALSNLFKDSYPSDDDSSSEDESNSSTKDPNLLVEVLGSLLDKTCKKSLRELCVYLRGFDKNVEVEKIARHGKTLKWLFSDVATFTPSIYSLPDWERLCSSLEVIEQFDAAYCEVVADCNLAGNSEFLGYIQASATIPSLHTLTIITWPLSHGTDPNCYQLNGLQEKQNTKAYFHLLAGMATEIQQLRINTPSPSPSQSSPNPQNPNNHTIQPKTPPLNILSFGLPQPKSPLSPRYFAKCTTTIPTTSTEPTQGMAEVEIEDIRVYLRKGGLRDINHIAHMREVERNPEMEVCEWNVRTKG
ncbi:MAG: hypothetical protein Q9212_001942 [Teloschistes hypoglaucus]